MTIKPPKCRTCGKEEWRHVCSGIDLRQVAAGKISRKSKPMTPKAKQRMGHSRAR
jgi:hypothetical protein